MVFNLSDNNGGWWGLVYYSLTSTHVYGAYVRSWRSSSTLKVDLESFFFFLLLPFFNQHINVNRLLYPCLTTTCRPVTIPISNQTTHFRQSSNM